MHRHELGPNLPFLGFSWSVQYSEPRVSKQACAGASATGLMQALVRSKRGAQVLQCSARTVTK